MDQCSFGFNILREETDWRDDGTVKWTIREVDLHEVSVCNIPGL
ncbi:HK97 family phage prohead protease [Mediterraneibacter gnavus]|nr:HK97 family phage prohead protease [Mediterraneibacter gnavus]